MSKNKIFLQIGFILLCLAGVILLFVSNSKSNQAAMPSSPTVYFEGEYRVGEGEWDLIEEGKHIPATKGDVTLRGTFHMVSPSGEYIGPVGTDAPIAFFMDHINITICEEGFEPYMMDNENPMFGNSACGQLWVGYMLMKESTQPLELVVHNPHRYGNETAIDDMLSNLAVWVGTEFDRSVLEAGAFQRNVGLFFIIVAFVFLGTALFSSLLHIKNNNIIWLLGLSILFAGIYLVYSAKGIGFWSDSVIINTTALCLSMIFYMLILSSIINFVLERMKRWSTYTIVALGVVDMGIIIASLVAEVSIFDSLWIWMIVQNIVNIILSILLVIEAIRFKTITKIVQTGIICAFVAFAIDSVATGTGIWKGGMISSYVFVAMFTCALVFVLQVIPKSINAAIRATELEAEKNALDAELAESRISTMISQIRPHFIYNTLGSIEQLCQLDPPKAGELVHNFAKYLRGNFGELDNPKPILMSREMEHVKYYVSIETVRFPDMSFHFEMNSVDFELPALTIQPIVENAIKHGLMKLSEGGSIWVESYETEYEYCISVKDNGVGFDTDKLMDERKHLGLRNIRGRLEAMVNGTMEIKSVIGEGTTVLIKIPKEEHL